MQNAGNDGGSQPTSAEDIHILIPGYLVYSADNSANRYVMRSLDRAFSYQLLLLSDIQKPVSTWPVQQGANILHRNGTGGFDPVPGTQPMIHASRKVADDVIKANATQTGDAIGWIIADLGRDEVDI